MDSRREFLKKAAVLTGGIGISATIPSPIQKAMLIDPNPGTTFYDAEHIVFLMQENRSFDHLFGNLKGVRGFNDPRAQILTNKNKVWIQNDAKGTSYSPFRMDLKKTQITWQGGLPHDWHDQVAARNKGRHDNWIPVKTPMCMGYYNREDIPFYYALADSFTVCDHSFCASLTGTTPNRLFFWTGTNRPEQTAESKAVVSNSQAESRNNVYVDWEAFPELLEDNGIDWRVYQNELWTADLQDEENDNWLGNYGDNPLEYVQKYNVKLSAYFRKNGDHTGREVLTAEEVLEKYNQLSEREKSILDRAFTTNIDAPDDYLEMTSFAFQDDEGNRKEVMIPKNDVFHQFRKDVDTGKLPTVSWLVAPQKFSDHTDTPLYGTWYVSEAMDILTKNPEVWKKTIFILTYDENDGYFDHVPPFAPPKPNDSTQGKVSEGIDTALDYEPKKGSPVGLGYRIPMIIASPWSKGGYVNSQVFDHTSSLMFLEKFLSKKTGKVIKSNNISPWRRTVCGDLTSVFRPFKGEVISFPDYLVREEVVTSIQRAKTKPVLEAKKINEVSEIDQVNNHGPYSTGSSVFMPVQERGIKNACPIPYQLLVDGNINETKSHFEIDFTATLDVLNETETVGSAFHVYTPKKYKDELGKAWAYAVRSGDALKGDWEIARFENAEYDIYVNGPNGFYRHFTGNEHEPLLKIKCLYHKTGLIKKRVNGNIQLEIANFDIVPLVIQIKDNSYKSGLDSTLTIQVNEISHTLINLEKSHGWYDFSIAIKDHPTFLKRYAGHVEMGIDSITDPFMGGIV